MNKFYAIALSLLLSAVYAPAQTLSQTWKYLQQSAESTNNQDRTKATTQAIGSAGETLINLFKKKDKPKGNNTNIEAGETPRQNAPSRDARVFMPASDYAGDASAASEWLRKADADEDTYKKIDYCNQALKADPSSVNAYYLRATYLVDAGDHEKALNDFEKFLEYRPDNAEALNGRGYCKQQLGRHQDAIKDFGLSIANNNPNLDYVFNNRGWSYALSNEHQKAIEDFDKAIKMNPALTDAYFHRGFCLYQLNNPTQAIVAFDQAINQQTNYLQAWYFRGLSKAALNHHKDAILDFNKILSQQPTDQDALLARADSKISLEKYQEASEDCTKLIQLNPDNADAYNNRGYCLLQTNKNSDAIADFTKSLELKNATPYLVYTNRAKAYFNLQLTDKALADYTQATNLEPTYQEALDGKQMLLRLKNPEAGAAQATRPSNYLKRRALVIGNSHYSYTQPLSQNPINDANDLSKKLKELGFKVMTMTDATKRQMADSLQVFTASAQNTDLITVFYAGHGIEHEGVNYLIPIDAKIDSIDHVKAEAISLDDVLNGLRRCEAKIGLVFLDACRNTPFRSWVKNRTSTPIEEAKRGAYTGAPSLSRNEMVYYATQPRQVAGNGTGRNGDLSGALLMHLRRGVELKTMWQEVTNSVDERTQHVQLPYSSGSLLTDLVF